MKQILSEEVLKMQKRAGIITESKLKKATKNLDSDYSLFNEADYWKENVDTSKVFPVNNDKKAESLLSGKIVAVYRVEKEFDALDVYGKTQNLQRGILLDVHFLINSDNKHVIYVDRERKRYFPSDYRGKDQLNLFESNTTRI